MQVKVTFLTPKVGMIPELGVFREKKETRPDSSIQINEGQV